MLFLQPLDLIANKNCSPIDPAKRCCNIMVYAYITVLGYLVEFSVPKRNALKWELNAWSIDVMQLKDENIPSDSNHKGNFSFTVYKDGQIVTHQWVEINVLTDMLGNGTMTSPQYTPSIFVEGIVITYGFYTFGAGIAGLPRSSQCYVTVTANCSDWMGEAAPVGSFQAGKPFSRFVLPSAHNVGMNDTQHTDIVFENATSSMVKILKDKVPLFRDLTETWAGVIGPKIAYSLAFTPSQQYACNWSPIL